MMQKHENGSIAEEASTVGSAQYELGSKEVAAHPFKDLIHVVQMQAQGVGMPTGVTYDDQVACEVTSVKGNQTQTEQKGSNLLSMPGHLLLRQI